MEQTQKFMKNKSNKSNKFYATYKSNMSYKTYRSYATYFVLFVLLCSFFVTPQKIAHAGILSRPPTNLGLVGFWPMDEGVGNKVIDASGQGNIGTISGATWANGKHGKALSIDGSNDYISVSNNSNLNILAPNKISVAMWAKYSLVANRVVLEKSTNNTHYHFQESETGLMFFGVSINTSTGRVFSTAPMNDGQWHHYVGVFDPVANTLQLYIDGVLNNTNSNATDDPSSNSSPLLIGSRSGSFAFQGSLDEIRIYNRALTTTEISKMYSSGQISQKQVSNSGLVGYWSMNEGRGNKVNDSSGNANTGTIIGATWAGGRFGEGLNFSARTQYANIANTSAVADNLADFTVSNWFKTSATASSYGNVMVSKISGLAAGNGWAVMELNNSGKYSGLLQSSNGSAWVQKLTTATFNDNRWHHGVSVFSNNTITLYIDGQAVTQSYSNTGTLGSYTNTNDIRIGNDFTSEGFLGALDDARIYNRALTADEVQALYTQTEVKINSSQNNKLTNGLVGLWSFNGPDYNSASTTAEVLDRSGQGNNGNNFGATVAQGKLGQALSFDGSDKVDISSTASSSAENITISAWVKLPAGFNSSSNTAGIYHLGDAPSTDDILLRFDGPDEHATYGGTNGALCFAAYNGSAFVNACSSQTSWDANVWYHVVATMDTVTAGQKVYVNGVVVGTNANKVRGTSKATNSLLAAIWNNGDTAFFRGVIDEARIYNRALSASEVKQLYLMGK